MSVILLLLLRAYTSIQFTTSNELTNNMTLVSIAATDQMKLFLFCLATSTGSAESDEREWLFTHKSGSVELNAFKKM